MNDKLLRSFSKFLSGNTIASILSLVNISIISKEIGLAGFGVFILCQTCYLLVEQVCNIRGWQNLISKKEHESHHIKELFGTNNTINFLSFLLSFFVLSILLFFSILSKDFFVGIFIYIFLILFRNYDSAYVALRLADKYGTLSLCNVALSFSRLCALLVFSSLFTLDVVDVVVVFVVTEILYFFLINFICCRFISNYFCFFKLDWSMIASGYKINLTTIFDLPVSTIDTYIIQYYFGNELLGAYKLIRKYVSVLGRVVSPLNQIVFPEISKLVGKARRLLIIKTILFTAIICCTLAIILYVSIFEFGFEFFESLYSITTIDVELLFKLLLLIEVFALVFSILNFLLIVSNQNSKNYKIVLLANIIFFITLFSTSFMSYNLIFVASLSMFLQVFTLAVMRIRVVFLRGGQC